MKLDLMAVLLAFPTVATSGCEKRRDDPSTTRTTGATTDTTSTMNGEQRSSIVSASTLIAGARCDRHGACGEVGAKKRFETREMCTREETNRAQRDIRGADCPNGVDDDKLQSCLDTIVRQGCANLTPSLAAMNECKTASLCPPRP